MRKNKKLTPYAETEKMDLMGFLGLNQLWKKQCAIEYNQNILLTFLIVEEEFAAGRSLKIQYPVLVHYNCTEWHNNEACVSRVQIPQTISNNPKLKLSEHTHYNNQAPHLRWASVS